MVFGVSILVPLNVLDLAEVINLEEGGAAVILQTAARLRKDPDFVDSAAG